MHTKFAAPNNLLGIAAGSLALGGASYAGLSALADILRTRYLALNKPTWDMQGQARLFGENADTYSYVKGQETLYKGMYDIPYAIAEKESKEFVDDAESMAYNNWRNYKIRNNFGQLVNSPEVQALGQEKARQLYMQMGKLVPDVIRKAPNVALSVMQSAIASDSQALRPEVVYNLARAQGALS